MKKNRKPISFKDAIALANKIGIVAENNEWESEAILTLKDGTRLYFISNYEGQLSDVTPGEGTQRPTVEIEYPAKDKK